MLLRIPFVLLGHIDDQITLAITCKARLNDWPPTGGKGHTFAPCLVHCVVIRHGCFGERRRHQGHHDSRRWETLILTNCGDSAHIDPS